MKRALCFGANGFIGHHLCRRLKDEGYFVKGIDNATWGHDCRNTVDEFESRDLRVPFGCKGGYDEVYQLAAQMGGMGYISGENDASIMHDSVMINANVAEACRVGDVGKVLFTSSACIYPEMQETVFGLTRTLACLETDTILGHPDSDYGWEKLFSERLYQAYHRQHDLDIRIARLHNVFGPECQWNTGREKAPAAICRKVALASNDSIIEIWGDGRQTRSFLYIDECLDGIRRLMNSDYREPVNIGSDVSITIEDLVMMVADIAGKRIGISYIDGPVGVQGRNSDNDLCKEKLGWAPSRPLREGMARLYKWVEAQVLTERSE